MNIVTLPAEINWYVYRGDTNSLSIFINDDAGDPIDVSTWIWTALAVDEDAHETDLICIGGDGLVTVDIPWPMNSSTFDVQAIKDDLSVWTAVRGTILVTEDVTQ